MNLGVGTGGAAPPAIGFAHNDAEWPDLLDIVAQATNRQVAFVEKDYWVTHTLWSLKLQARQAVQSA